MIHLADAAIRSTALILLGLAACHLLRRRSAALRHAVLAATMFAALGILPLQVFLPAWNVPVLSGGGAHVLVLPHVDVSIPLATRDLSPLPSTSHRPTVAGLVLLFWALGASLAAGMLFASLARLQRIARNARPAEDGEWTRILAHMCASEPMWRRVTLCHTEAPDLLATIGWWHPCVLLPLHARDWSPDRIRVVLAHEVAHIRRHDWAVQLAAEIARALCWFNPVVWIACTRLRHESEQACDDVVLAGGVEPSEYATQLLALVRICRPRQRAWSAAMPMARPSTLERRFAAMLNPRTNRRPLSRHALVFTALLALIAAVPAASLRAGYRQPLTLSGVIYDPSGAVLPGVELTIEGSGQARWVAVTGPAGQFEVPGIDAGRYVLQASLAGFRPLRDEFELRQEKDWDRAMTLQIGDVRESIAVSVPRTNAASSPQASASPQPVKVGGNLRTPRKLKDVRPVYPPAMSEAGREGVVPIEAVIGRDGLVHSARVLSANVHPDFAVAAIDAVRQWRFEPTLLNGVPAEVTMTVSVAFSLSN
jgi:TonB family protein